MQPQITDLHGQRISNEAPDIMIELVTVERTEIELAHILRWEDDGGYLLQQPDALPASMA